MKKFIITSILAVLTVIWTATMAQNWPDEYLGLPGDNLNLYAVMKLFQESETLEGFERTLNDENSRINNLDLNGDNLVDYIMVIDYVDGDVHTIVLQVAIDRYDKQDVAVFTVQKFRNGAVQIQLIGDEALYGKNYIIEPVYDENYAETPNPGYIGRRSQAVPVRTTTIIVESWPLVRYIYLPDYVIWRSSWYWGYYPPYWNPWRPFYWHYYYGYHYHWHPHYYRHYRHWDHFRYARYHDFYYSGIRSHSPHVSVRIRDGHYRTTYSHPELRSEGEALYNRTQSRRDSGASGSVAAGSQDRRSVSQSSQDRTSTGTATGTSRRSTTTGTSTSADRNTGTSRRSTTAAPARTKTSTSTDRSTSSTRRSTTAAPARKETSTSDDRNTSTSRRSSTAAPARTETGTSSDRNLGSSRRSETTVYTRAAVSTSTGRNTATVSRPAAATSGRTGTSSSNSSSSTTMRRIPSPASATGSYSRVEAARRPSYTTGSSSSAGSRSRSAVASSSAGTKSRSVVASGSTSKKSDNAKESNSGTASRRR